MKRGDYLKHFDASQLASAAEKQRLKQLCKDFQNMIHTEDGARFFVFMMEVYNTVDVDSFVSFVSDLMHDQQILPQDKPF